MEKISHEPASEYHKKAKLYLSSHQLSDFRKCPLLYIQNKRGEIEETKSAAYTLGTAFHTMILEGWMVYNVTYQIGGPINPKTGKSFGTLTKAFEEFAATCPLPILTEEDDEQIRKMKNTQSILAGTLLSNGVAEGVIRKEYNGIDCQIRMDWWREADQVLVDLKTCESLDWFESDMKKYSYFNQLAFYQAISGAKECYIVAAEKRAPYRWGCWHISQSVLDQHRKENEKAMDKLKLAEKNDVWLTGYEDIRLVEAV